MAFLGGVHRLTRSIHRIDHSIPSIGSGACHRPIDGCGFSGTLYDALEVRMLSGGRRMAGGFTVLARWMLRSGAAHQRVADGSQTTT